MKTRKKRIDLPKVWTADKIAELRAIYNDFSTKELAKHFNCSPNAIRFVASRNGIYKKNNFRWNEESIQLLTELFPTNSNASIAKKLGSSKAAVAQKASKLGLKKDIEYIKDNPLNSGRFQKGHIPATLGKKMSPETKAKLANTLFKKGNKPHNIKPEGYEHEYTDGYVKIQHNGKMRLKHVVVWESVNGKVPKGHIIVFKNKNNRDFSIENLECITLQENMKRNCIHQWPDPIKKLMRVHARLRRKIKEKQENNTNQQK